MNNGAFGENFPYSNFHDLNMDWIIKIAKDFLDQYTHIQDIIEQGEEDITNLTEEELQALTNKKEELEALLEQWYETHSADIAQQLASAITAFNTSAEAKATQTLATIPADYTNVSRGGNACLTSWTPIRWEGTKLVSYRPIIMHINSMQIHRDVSTLINGQYEVDVGIAYDVNNPYIIYSVSQNILSGATYTSLQQADFILVATAQATGIVANGYKGNSYLSSASTIYWEGSTIWSYSQIYIVSCDTMRINAIGTYNSTNARYEVTSVGVQGVQNVLAYSKSYNIITTATDSTALSNPDLTIVQAPVHTGITPFNDTYGLQTAITFGTSVTWYDGREYNNGAEEGVTCKGYQHYLRAMLNMVVTNEGVDGADMPRICQQVLSHANFDDYEYIFIEGGVNDQRKGTPMGVTVPVRNSVTGESSTIDNTTFKGALQYILEYIFYKKPTAKVFILTPLQGYLRAGSYESSPEGIIDPKWGEAMKEVASLYSVPVIDLYNEMWISPANLTSFFNDPVTPANKEFLHPSTIGYKRMGEVIVTHMKAQM